MHDRLYQANDSNQVTEWRFLWQLLPYLGLHRGRVALAVLLLVLAKAATVVVPLALKYLIEALDPALQNATAGLLVIPLGLILAYGSLRFASVLFAELRDAVFGRVAENTMSRIGLKVFSHLHELDLEFHLSRRTGALSRDIERGTQGVTFLLRAIVFSIAPILIEVLLVAVILSMSMDLRFGLVVLMGVVFYVAYSVLMTNWRTRFLRDANLKDTRASGQAIDSLLNFETVKYFNNEAYEAERYAQSLAAREDAKVKNHRSLALLNSGQALIIALSVTLVMYLAADLVVQGKKSIGDLAMVNAYLIQVFIPLNVLGFVYREIKRSMTDVEAMFSLLSIRPTIIDAEDAREWGPDLDGIRFDRVSFRYHPERPIIRDLSFSVPAGGKVAIVGSSGAGKSTIARLIFRFYDVDEGSVSVGGVDIRQLTQLSWRSALGVVPQDTVLLNTSIRENILYGNPSANEQALLEAIRIAHLNNFIEQLPQGLDTLVGERGFKVSGGERQRIAIARMLLKNPTIMIFDEATSSLDSVAERSIMKAFGEISRHHTTLVIAHRLSTIADADQILVLENGSLLEQGNHAGLLARKQRYYELWTLQQQEAD